MPGIYGGDEINAIVIDSGSYLTRAGWAGEDAPRVVAPSSYGYLPIADDAISALEADAAYTSPAAVPVSTPPPKDGTDGDGDQSMADADADANAQTKAPTSQDTDDRLKLSKARAARKTLSFIDREKKRRHYVGDESLSVWRDGLQVATPYDEDGIVSDVPAFQSLCTYSLDSLSADPRQHPLLLTEPAWNSKEARERMTEVAFEGLNVPAFYLANRSVLSSFASGRPVSLLVDIGYNSVSAIPIVDGFVIRKGIQRQDNAGESVSRALLYSLNNDRNKPDGSSSFKGITPQFLVKSKAAVDPGHEPQFKIREDRLKGTTESFKSYHVSRALRDFKEATAQALEVPWNPDEAQVRGNVPYEFPDGYNDVFGLERLKAAETILTPSIWSSTPGVLTAGRNYEGLSNLIMNAVNATDVDSRTPLLSNIVVVGGGSMLPFLTDRLSLELTTLAPMQRIKIHAPGNTTERKHSSWLGGSILAGLGSFHQLWISKQEYEEHGSAIVHARCK